MEQPEEVFWGCSDVTIFEQLVVGQVVVLHPQIQHESWTNEWWRPSLTVITEEVDVRKEEKLVVRGKNDCRVMV